MEAALEAQPRKKTLRFAEIEFSIDGSVAEADAIERAKFAVSTLERRLDPRPETHPFGKPFYKSKGSQGIVVGEYNVAIEEWNFDYISIEQGSIIVRCSLIGVIALQAYSAVADYPSFKEAVPILIEDISTVLSGVINFIDRGQPPVDGSEHPKIQFYFREEEDLIVAIQNSK